MDKSYYSEKNSSNSHKKHKKRHKTICSHGSNHFFISQSNKNNNNIITSRFEKQLSIKKEALSNNASILSSEYKKDLFEKFSNFLDKKKFKLCNNFDARNSKKFLSKKDKCLEKIVLSDKIENEEDDNLRKLGTIDSKSKEKFKTEKNIHKYFIVISNYDEEQKSKNNSKKKKNKLNKTKTINKQK